jgi:acyl-CoA thioester hydrolase
LEEVMSEFASATVRITPSFHDCDPMGVVWHGNYFKFFERAREALFQEKHYGYAEMRESGYAWPVVDARVKYRRPLLVEQPVDVTVRLTEFENRLVFDYEIRAAAGGRVLTKGRTVHIACDVARGEGLMVTPAVFLEKFGLEVL